MTDTAQPNGALTGVIQPPINPVAVQGADVTVLMAMLQRAASDPGIDLDRMERLFNMLQQIEARRAESAYAAAMAAAQAKIVPVTKNRPNTQTHSRYADLAAITEACMPIINSMGFAISGSECQPKSDGYFGLRLDVSHSGGCTKTYEFQVPLDGAGFKGTANKTATHAYGSSFSYARRYGICGVFNIATKDDDGNAQSRPAEDNEIIGEAELKELSTLMEMAGIDPDQILEFHKLDSMTDMPKREFKRAKYMLNQRIKTNKAASATKKD